MNQKVHLVLYLSLLFITCTSQKLPEPKVQTGLDRVNEYQQLFKDKRVGIITNHTAYNSHQQHISDIFLEMDDVTISVLFGPEHGIRGSAEAGAKVESGKNPVSNIPIYSLYGETRKPTPGMLKDVDILVFDIQDIGARFYTYIYTMAYAMAAAAEQGIAFVVLDRPNPINGIKVEGNILESEFASFVGLFPIPVSHGMTVGELAKMFNEEGWLTNGIKADLTVIPMKNWHREFWYDETGLPFIKPSPNIPDLESATVYPGVCLLEGTNVSEGRGTANPFQIFGAPWINGARLAERLNILNLSGVAFKDTLFTPVSIAGVATHPKYENNMCFGVKIKVTGRNQFQPYRTGIHIVYTIHQMYPDSLKWRIRHFDRLCGSASIREAILNGTEAERLFVTWQERFNKFMEKRRKYLIYNE
jgi:uncharacterized protein YbbC (DUF1343 family)